MPPGAGGPGQRALSASLVAASASGGLETYAQTLVAGASIAKSEDVERLGVRGKTYVYSKDGTRYGLVLFGEGETAHGLYIQGDEKRFEEERRAVDEMMASFTLERAAAYPEHKDERFGFRIRVPSTWRALGRMSNAQMVSLQFLSPALALDRSGSVHLALMLKAEPAARLEDYYAKSRQTAGEVYKVTSHKPWRDGYVDVETIETPVAVTHAKRFYRVANGRGYVLSFEAREDVFYRVSTWCDAIAATFELFP